MQRGEGFAAAVAVLLLFVAVAAADALGNDEEDASPPAAARPLQPIARTAGNASLAPMSDWKLTPEGHSGAWEGSHPQQLVLPLLTGMRYMRSLQATPTESSQLGCLKCNLNRLLGEKQLISSIARDLDNEKYHPAPYRPYMRFQTAIVDGMHNLYDERIIDQYTDRNLLNWAVTTYQEGRYYQYDLAVLTTGPMNYDPAAAATCDVDGNLPDNPCLTGGSLHTTWTYRPSDKTASQAHLPLVVVRGGDTSPPLNTQLYNELFVRLAQLSKDDARAAAGPEELGPRFFSGVLQLMKCRARLATAVSQAVASCTASTYEEPLDAPLDLTIIRVCVQDQISSLFGSSTAPRGILVVPARGSVPYIPSGHLNGEKFISIFVGGKTRFSRVHTERVDIHVIMLASRQALGPSL